MKKFIIGLVMIIIPYTLHAFPEIIDFKQRNHNTVKHLEISPVIVPYYGDVLETSVLYGSRFNYHLSQAWSLGGTFLYGESVYDTTSAPISGRNSDTHIIYDGHFMYSIPAALRISKDIPLEADMYTILGAGEEYIGGDNHTTILLGGGLKMYTGIPWLAVRIGIRDYFYKVTISGENKTVDDLVMMIGVSFLFL